MSGDGTEQFNQGYIATCILSLDDQRRAVRKGWKVKGFEVVAAYPHSLIYEKIYIRLPDGFKTAIPGHVLELHPVLYGKKQAVRCWWKHFQKILNGIGCQ